MNNNEFWNIINQLLNNNEIIIDRPKGSYHPIMHSIVYPVDYGYISNVKSSDSEELDIWVGTDIGNSINGVICTVDLHNKDCEVKIVYNCTDKEIENIISFSNERKEMKGIYIENQSIQP